MIIAWDVLRYADKQLNPQAIEPTRMVIIWIFSVNSPTVSSKILISHLYQRRVLVAVRVMKFSNLIGWYY